jgi:hypothetical protein
MADKDRTSESIGDRSFATTAASVFGDVARRYRLKEVSRDENRVVLASDVSEVTVQLERGQVFVDIGPRGEAESFDLGEIILLKSPESGFEYANPATTTVVDELRRLEQLVSQHGDGMLGGDFSQAQALLALRAKRFRDLTGGS